MAKEQIGTITELGVAFIPSATVEVNGRTYAVGTTPTGAPVVRSEASQRDWRIQAEELVALAVRAGIDRAG